MDITDITDIPGIPECTEGLNASALAPKVDHTATMRAFTEEILTTRKALVRENMRLHLRLADLRRGLAKEMKRVDDRLAETEEIIQKPVRQSIHQRVSS